MLFNIFNSNLDYIKSLLVNYVNVTKVSEIVDNENRLLLKSDLNHLVK